MLTTFALYSVAVVPYFACGWILGVVFRDHAEQIHRLYFIDLVGAGLGCILFVALIRPTGATVLVVVACALVGVSALALDPGAENRRPALALAGLLAPLCALSGTLDRAMVPNPEKHQGQFVKVAPGDSVTVEQSEWNTLSRIDVVSKASDPDLKGIFIDGDAWTWTHRQFAEGSRLPTRDLVWPYVFGHQPAEVLIIGSGGGYEVWNAVRSGAAHIDALEINPSTYRFVRDVYRDWNGGLFTRPEVSFHNEDGRSFVSRSSKAYDLIMMQGVDTFTALDSRAYVLSESYLYTVEAVEDYYAHLAPGGRLYMGRSDFPPQALRLFVNTLEALRRAGIPDPARHVMVNAWGVWMAVLVKTTPFTAEDLAQLDELPFWVQGTNLQFPSAERNPYTEYAEALAAGRGETYLASLPYDATPVTDDSPYYFHYERWRDLPRVLLSDDVSEHPILGDWPSVILFVMLAFAVVMVALFIALPLLLRSGDAPRARSGWWSLYFVCLGVAFIFIELALMQRFALLLGHPSRSLVLVLGVLLISAGVGSLVADRLPGALRSPFAPIVMLTLLAAFVYPSITEAALGLPLWARSLVAAALVAPLGLFLGIPFPRGLRQLGETAREAVPWMWGVNGGATVVGSIVATMIAMSYGFTVVLCIAAAGYAVAGLAARAANREQRAA